MIDPKKLELTTSQIIDYIENNPYSFRLPSDVKASECSSQHFFKKGNLVNVNINRDNNTMMFFVNSSDEGYNLSIIYNFTSLDLLAQKLVNHIEHFQLKDFKVEISKKKDILYKNTCYADMKEEVLSIRKSLPDTCVNLIWDLENPSKSFEMFPTYNSELAEAEYQSNLKHERLCLEMEQGI